MLYEIAYWHDDGEEERPPFDTLLTEPDHARFVEGWGRPGDLAVLALDRRDEPIGAAWCRRFTETEMRIAVFPEFRRQGVGSLLLGSLLARARAGGEDALEVEAAPDNPARRFLLARGFAETPDRPTRLVCDLAAELMG